MLSHPLYRRSIPLLLACALLSGPAWPEDPLQEILDTGADSASKAMETQQFAERIDAETRALADERRELQRQIEGLARYNARLERQAADQQRRLAALGQASAEATVLARDMVPLIERMIDSLEDFVALDRPFLGEERRARIASLRAGLDRADVSLASEFRAVLDAYLAEIAYGDGMHASTGVIGTTDGERTVELLRLGRIALFAQSGDGATTWQWDDASRSWQTRDDPILANEVRTGLAMARGERATAMLRLAIPRIEDAR
jgi:FtsZ-binding cell division protein ZapB